MCPNCRLRHLSPCCTDFNQGNRSCPLPRKTAAASWCRPLSSRSHSLAAQRCRHQPNLRSSRLPHPLPWRLSRSLGRNVRPNLERADWLRGELDPPVLPKLVEGFDPCAVPAATLKAPDAAATAAPVFDTTNAGTLNAASIGPPTTQSNETADADADADTIASYGGGNNWANEPGRTGTGRPILANGPHRAHGEPSPRYVARVSAPRTSAQWTTCAHAIGTSAAPQ